jgi:hypothetical protein
MTRRMQMHRSVVLTVLGRLAFAAESPAAGLWAALLNHTQRAKAKDYIFRTNHNEFVAKARSEEGFNSFPQMIDRIDRNMRPYPVDLPLSCTARILLRRIRYLNIEKSEAGNAKSLRLTADRCEIAALAVASVSRTRWTSRKCKRAWKPEQLASGDGRLNSSPLRFYRRDLQVKYLTPYL